MSHAQLKDSINTKSVARIASALSNIEPSFPAKTFKRLASENLLTLELKDRVYHIIAALHETLPKDFRKTTRLLTQLKKYWQNDTTNDRYDFTAWAITDYVGVHGIDHPKLALPLLQLLTPMFSAEFAIRPFIERHPELSWVHLHHWAEHKDHHVRRLASEGCRPRLPWGTRLQELIADPMPIIALLDKLKDDSSDYVRRSVANNLNDIAKDHPDLVVKVCKRWQRGKTAQREWIIRHATRTLVKKGHPAVFSLLGFTENPKVKLHSMDLSASRITLGQTLEFSAVLSSAINKEQTMVIDYAIHYVKANGSTSTKVYKLKNVTLDPNGKLLLQKKQPFKPISTRQFHTGEHRLELLVNGIAIGEQSFYLAI